MHNKIQTVIVSIVVNQCKLINVLSVTIQQNTPVA